MPKALYRSFYDCYHLPPSPRHSENKMKNLKKTYLSIYAVTIQQIQILEIALLLFENFVLKLLINACLYIQLIITNQRDSWLLDTYSNATLTPNNSRPFYTIDILISLSQSNSQDNLLFTGVDLDIRTGRRIFSVFPNCGQHLLQNRIKYHTVLWKIIRKSNYLNSSLGVGVQTVKWNMVDT